MACCWTVWGFHGLDDKTGTEAVGCFHPQGSFADGNGSKKAELEKFSWQTSLGGGEGSAGKRVTSVSSCPYFLSPQEVSVRDFQERVLSW